MRIFGGVLVLVGLATIGSASTGATVRGGCPKAALPLSVTNPIGPAARAALRKVSAEQKPQVTGAALALGDVQRGRQVKYQCGQAIAARTIVVYIVRRAYLPAQSASQGVYFVSRFASGYRVWQVAH